MLEEILDDYKCAFQTLVNLYIDTSAISLFLFQIYLSVILLLHLNLIGKLIVIFVEVITTQ